MKIWERCPGGILWCWGGGGDGKRSYYEVCPEPSLYQRHTIEGKIKQIKLCHSLFQTIEKEPFPFSCQCYCSCMEWEGKENIVKRNKKVNKTDWGCCSQAKEYDSGENFYTNVETLVKVTTLRHSSMKRQKLNQSNVECSTPSMLYYNSRNPVFQRWTADEELQHINFLWGGMHRETQKKQRK